MLLGWWGGGVMGGVAGQMMTNSRKVKGDVGSGWFMAEEWGRDGKCIKNVPDRRKQDFFEAEVTINPS